MCAVASGEGAAEDAFFVADREGDAVDFGFADEGGQAGLEEVGFGGCGEGRLGFGDPRPDFLLVVGVVDREHGNAVRQGRETINRRASDADGGGVGVGEFWVVGFEGGELGEEGVELGVGHEGGGIGVVGRVGSFEECAEFDDAGFVGHCVNDIGVVRYHLVMTAQIIDGKALAHAFREQVADRASALRARGFAPKLDAILVESGDNGARVYAQNQASTCQALGIEYQLHTLAIGSDQDAIEDKVRQLNMDDSVHAMMVHMPVPEGVDAYRIQELIDPVKDVEGVNPANIGNVVYGRSMRAPCTALATLKMIDSTGIDLKGKKCVVVGASAVVGRPIAVLLMQREATVVSCNKYTSGLKELCLSADVLIPAAGVAGLITGDMVRGGALVVDVGVNRIKGDDGKLRTVGDVDFEDVKGVAGWISPVPGGVGPMTVSVLLHNVIEVAQDRAQVNAQIK